MENILDRLESGEILLLDGAMGTELMRRGINLPDTALANKRKHGKNVKQIHKDYISAGADIIETNTFSGNFIPEAVELAKNAVGRRKIYVAGSIGPLGTIVDNRKSSYFLSEEDAYLIFYQKAGELKEAGIDFYLIETMGNLREAEAALKACKKYGLPVAVSFELNPDGKARQAGQTIEQIIKSCEENGADIIGANCMAGMQQAIDFTRRFRAGTKLPLIIYPDSTIPLGDSHYTESAQEMAAKLPELIRAGANIVGGCCGTTPQYILTFKKALESMGVVKG